MLVELIGPPGSGKSTLANSLSSYFKQPLINLDGNHHPDGTAASRLGRYMSWVGAIGSQPRLVLMAGKFISDHRGPLNRERAAMTLRRNFTCTRINFGILDEGPRHCLAHPLALLPTSSVEYWASKFASRLYSPDKVVRLRVNPASAVERITARGDQGIADLSQSILCDDAALRLYLQRYDLAARLLATVPTIEIDTTNLTVDEVANRAIAFII